jgi:hypothetical protein
VFNKTILYTIGTGQGQGENGLAGKISVDKRGGVVLIIEEDQTGRKNMALHRQT